MKATLLKCPAPKPGTWKSTNDLIWSQDLQDRTQAHTFLASKNNSSVDTNDTCSPDFCFDQLIVSTGLSYVYLGR